MRAAARAPEAPTALRVAGMLGGGLAAAVVVFSLGVMVGKRAAESALAPAAEMRALPTADLPPRPPPPAAAAPEAPPLDPGRLTFYDRLSGRAPAGPVDLPTGTAPPQAAAADSAAAPASPGAPAPAPPVAASAPAPPAASPASTAAAPDAPAADPAARLRTLRGRGPWSVQVAAVSQRAAADALVVRLRGLGIDAVATAVASRGTTLHRVRVGTFPTREAAGRAAGVLRDELALAGSTPVRD